MIVVDSITHVRADARGAVVVNGSHGGRVAAAMAVGAGVRAVIFNDAGVGRDNAGIAGLVDLDALGIAAAAVDFRSARIGDGADTLAVGIISHANAAARSLGVGPGQPCAAAAERLEHAPARTADAQAMTEKRALAATEPVRVWLLDSASQVTATDAGAIVVTGSHGGLLGGRPETAVKADVGAAIYNDAGIGRDRAGVSRLPALELRGIAAAAVSHDSARIGDARSSYDDGVISTCNAVAAALGVHPGQTCRAAVAALIARRTP